MKILCDVCNNNHASLFCTADEASLCISCDHRVHHANKLASKHNRLSLLLPSPEQSPLCDICQEKRAFVLCKQDRAILCNDCDSSIHSVNEFTLKHDRFLLTAIKLSSNSSSSSSLTSSSSTSSSLFTNSILVDSSSSFIDNSVLVPSSTSIINNDAIQGTVAAAAAAGSTISQYLIETLPGWQVDDFLDSSSVPFAFSKGDDLFDGGIEQNLDSLFPNSSNMGIWVPQAPPTPLYSSSQLLMGQSDTKKGNNRTRLRDDDHDGSIFTVPQISPVSNSKRSRYLW